MGMCFLLVTGEMGLFEQIILTYTGHTLSLEENPTYQTNFYYF